MEPDLMRVLKSKHGSRLIPAFGTSGQRMPEFDLYVALGASRDPRHQHPGPKTIVIAAPSKKPRIGVVVDPVDVKTSQWVFDFGPRDIDGEPTLAVTMRAEGDATKFEEMPNDDKWGKFFMDLTVAYATLCK